MLTGISGRLSLHSSNLGQSCLRENGRMPQCVCVTDDIYHHYAPSRISVCERVCLRDCGIKLCMVLNVHEEL